MRYCTRKAWCCAPRTTASTTRPARSALPSARPITAGSDASAFGSTTAAFACSASIAAGRPHDSTKAHDMSEAKGLSEEHATWLEERGIPIELAAELELHSSGRNLAFPYRTPDGEIVFTKLRGPEKSFRIEPAGRSLQLWL